MEHLTQYANQGVAVKLAINAAQIFLCFLAKCIVSLEMTVAMRGRNKVRLNNLVWEVISFTELLCF